MHTAHVFVLGASSFIFLASIILMWSDNDKTALKDWIKENPGQFILISTFRNFYFWVATFLSLTSISMWALLVGIFALGWFVVDEGIDVLGPPPPLEAIELD
jgi:hypothetical protein